MSPRVPTRWAGQSALSTFVRPNTYWRTTCRYVSDSSKPSPSSSNSPPKQPEQLTVSAPLPSQPTNPKLRNDLLYKLLQDRQKPSRAQTSGPVPTPTPGTLAPSSIFSPDAETPGWREEFSEEEKQKIAEADRDRRALATRKAEAEISASKLDPQPHLRKLVERQFVINSLRTRGRLTKDAKLMRTERQSLTKSWDLPVSTKKLSRVMHQIKGKTVEEALVQLRFSKKKIAKDVIKGLQSARDEAIVSRGMGLGHPNGRRDPKVHLVDGTRLAPKSVKSVTIELKDGKRKEVHDPTEMYIDQAWVGKSFKWNSPEYRARGMVNMLIHRVSHFSVLLKEEKTRMRISEEIKKKRDNRKLWVALPDRPVTTQRQYCLW